MCLGPSGWWKRLPRSAFGLAVKDKNLVNVRKGFRCKRLPQSRGSFAMTVRNGPYPQFPAKRVLTRNDKWGVELNVAWGVGSLALLEIPAFRRDDTKGRFSVDSVSSVALC